MSINPIFSTQMTVKLIRAMAADEHVIQAAQVSSKGENKPETVPQRFIEALMRGRHGSPFEHTSMVFYIKAPLFVFTEQLRHRIGTSVNQRSGRYSDPLNEFYRPPTDRFIVNAGTKMTPEFILESGGLWEDLTEAVMQTSRESINRYYELKEKGVAEEVARILLPQNLYSEMYWTVNARSLMNYLSLRVSSPDSMIPTYPQQEIQWVAEQIETHFAELMPVTHAAFVKFGRVAP